MKKVYEELRASKHWEDTVLLITYDEHGGFFDHIVPPSNVTNPSPEYEGYPYKFDFQRLGNINKYIFA